MSAIADETTSGNPPLALRAGLRPRLAFVRRIDLHLGGLAGHLGEGVFAGERALRMRAGAGIRRRAANGTQPALGLGLDGNGLTLAHGTSFHAAAAIGRASKFNRPAPHGGQRPRRFAGRRIGRVPQSASDRRPAAAGLHGPASRAICSAPIYEERPTPGLPA